MSRADRELQDEIAAHLAEAVDDYVARGLSPEDARLAALRDFGGVTQAAQVHRELRRFHWAADAFQDARHAWRRMAMDGTGSLLAVLTLAVGIGLSTSLFSVIDATILRPLPYPDPEQLVDVRVEEDQPDGTTASPTPSMADMRLWQGAVDVFSDTAAWGTAFRGRVLDDPHPRRVSVMHFTERYLAMHGVAPLLGRDFVREDCEPGAPLVALLGYGHWQSAYAGSQDVLGQTVRLGDDVATIVGVLPAWFNADTPFVLPHQVPLHEHDWRGTGRVTVYARLRAGVTTEQAAARLTAMMPTLSGRDGAARQVRVVVESRLEKTTSGNRTTVNLLAGAVGLILLIACVNVAAVLLARGAGRESELAVRSSLGAGRARLIRQLLTESLMLAVAGGLLGTIVAWLSLEAIVANLPLASSPNAPIELNARVLVFTAALLIPTTVLFGAVPALRLSRVRIPPLLARRRHLGSPFTRRGGQWLIATETALVLILLAGAGLMLRSFARISAVDLGFTPDGLLTITVLPLDKDVAGQKQVYANLIHQIRTVPGVSSVGMVDNFALGDGTRYTTLIGDGRRSFSTIFTTTPGYLETIGARLRAGRFMTEADAASGARGVVINESAARQLFGRENAVGLSFTQIQSDIPPWTVIGVIGDLRHRGPIYPRGKNQPQAFFPYLEAVADVTQPMTIIIKSTDAHLPEQIRSIAESTGSRLLIERIASADRLFADHVLTPKRRTALLTMLGAIGLLLALVGISGMTAYAVAIRTPEIGVRMAFGAQPIQVVAAVLRDAAFPIATGVLLGIGGARLATPAIQSLLFETTATDPTALAGAALLLFLTGCLAAFASARRAAKIDPAVSLRAE